MTDIDHGGFKVEARKRWGNTEVYRTSAERTAGYGDSEWTKIRAEAEAIEAAFADAMASGLKPDSKRGVELAEDARAHIDRWYYPCSPAMHASLAEMYTADDRFRAHYDDRAEGLAEYVAAAIKANERMSRA